MVRKLIVFITLMVLVACGESEKAEPREINNEIDACEICQMSIAHNEYATQVIDKQGIAHIHDDIGCLMEYMERNEDEIEATFVKVMDNNEWVALEEAVYVYHEDFWTPMANGVIAFSSGEAAEQFLQSEKKGEFIELEDVKKLDWSH